jgi:signal transduction histidine kinase
MDFACESDQQLNRNLAKNLVKKFQPFFADSIHSKKIKQEIGDLMVMNPTVEIYLLQKDGTILAVFEDESSLVSREVNITPIIDFLDPDQKVPFPIMGDDPRSTKKKVFSAAEFNFGDGEQGYLYVIIGGELYDSIISSLRGSYIISTTVIAFLITFVFAAIVGLLLFFLVTKRLHKMTEVIQEFEVGNYNHRININSKDEVGHLANAFNNMADRIQTNLKQLKLNDQQRREFIANVSHDLRSPLASIMGYIETMIMKDEELSSTERKKFMDVMYHNVTNLNTLVHQLFELSKLDAMETKPLKEPFSIGELAQDVVLNFQKQAENKNIALRTKIPINLPFVEGDIGMIDRVLSNLIDNALRYSKTKGEILVEVVHENEKIKVSVNDNGIGIPEKDLPHIFERFYRVEKSRSRLSGGSGLGLAIVKKILEAHNSYVTVKSHPNEGTSFSFALNQYQPLRSAKVSKS